MDASLKALQKTRCDTTTNANSTPSSVCDAARKSCTGKCQRTTRPHVVPLFLQQAQITRAGLILEQVSVDFEEKTLVKDANVDQMLPVFHRQVKELAERVMNQKSKMAEITREVRASEQTRRAKVVQAAATILSTMPERLPPRQNPTEEATTSSPVSRSGTVTAPRKFDYYTILTGPVV
ncbi:hypothetical protein MTO96_014648 [Rhipicephalus appendiculatus]